MNIPLSKPELRSICEALELLAKQCTINASMETDSKRAANKYSTEARNHTTLALKLRSFLDKPTKDPTEVPDKTINKLTNEHP